MPTCEQLRWLANTQLAYGAGGITWYVYGHPGHDGGFAYLNKNGAPSCRPTPFYHFVKEELHKEFFQIAKVLQPLKSVGVYHLGMLPPGAVALPLKNEFKLEPEVENLPLPKRHGMEYSDYRGSYRVAYYETPVRGFVMGCFGNDKKTTHAFVVNLDFQTYYARGWGRDNDKVVWHKLVGPGPLEVFDAKTGKWSDAGKEGVDLDLPPGGGILVRVKGL
jgi:hypothetical protein